MRFRVAKSATRAPGICTSHRLLLTGIAACNNGRLDLQQRAVCGSHCVSRIDAAGAKSLRRKSHSVRPTHNVDRFAYEWLKGDGNAAWPLAGRRGCSLPFIQSQGLATHLTAAVRVAVRPPHGEPNRRVGHDRHESFASTRSMSPPSYRSRLFIGEVCHSTELCRRWQQVPVYPSRKLYRSRCPEVTVEPHR